jgi:DNA-binding response OmpR family regulator
MKAHRVLLMEDNALIGAFVAEMLAEMGHTVCGIEATETEAIAAALRFKPDLMIVDARLADGSGIAAVEEILRTGFVPHVFVSGDIGGVRALRPRAIVIQKPFRRAELDRAIQRALAAADAPPEGRAPGERAPWQTR